MTNEDSNKTNVLSLKETAKLMAKSYFSQYLSNGYESNRIIGQMIVKLVDRIEELENRCNAQAVLLLSKELE